MNFNILSYQIRLPPTPDVITREKTVVIVYRDGTETIWGEEKTLKEAIKIAQELEIELRAINYLKWHVRTFITDMKKMLHTINADEKLLLSIINDGHEFAFKELDPNTAKTLRLDNKPKLKEIILGKIDSSYIV